jgi:hypothetical protein
MQPVLFFGEILVGNSLSLGAENFRFMQPVLRFGEVLVSNSLFLRAENSVSCSQCCFLGKYLLAILYL